MCYRSVYKNFTSQMNVNLTCADIVRESLPPSMLTPRLSMSSRTALQADTMRAPSMFSFCYNAVYVQLLLRFKQEFNNIDVTSAEFVPAGSETLAGHIQLQLALTLLRAGIEAKTRLLSASHTLMRPCALQSTSPFSGCSPASETSEKQMKYAKFQRFTVVL